MAGKLVKRTLDIIKSGVDTKVKDYTSNWTSFRNDAREVKDILIKGETNAADTVQKLKRTGITKKISEWFYGAETEFDSSGSDSDFDPGFSVESSSDNKLDGEKSSSSLTYESMKDLSAKQTGMMVKIGRRQTEQSVANTAEVISTINNRTAEMVAVMNNINTSLKGVNDRLDKLIKIQSVGIEAEEERALNSEGGIYDSEGRLSLKGIFDAAKSSGGGYIGSSLGMLGNLKGGLLTPEMLFGFALDKALNKPMSGGKSINQMGKEFNEFIGNSIQTALTGVLESKVFTDLFGNITGFNAGRDYGELRTNRYDTKRAQFDGMTRHSIVKIMPELLIKLNENVSGKSYHINQNGDIVEGPAKNYFNEAVSGAIGAHGINSRAMSAVRSGMQQVFKKEIPQQDIDTAADALVHYFILQMESAGGRMLTKADIRAHEIDATKQACEMLGMVNTDTSKGYDYWSRVCQTILYKVANGNTMDANAFVSNVNQSLRNMQKAAADHATNSFYSNQAGRITSNVIQQSFISKHGNEQQISRATTTTASKFTTADYVKGIFAILNRGVNVKLVNGINKGHYKRISEEQVRREPWQIDAPDDESAQLLVNALSGNKNAIKNSMESALGLLGGANNATGGRIGALNTAANLATTFNQGRQFLDRIKGNRFAQNINAAFHGDASGLQAQFDGAMNRVGNALPYGVTHDQRMINMANSARGIGSNMLQHGANALNAGRQKFQNQNTNSGAGRLVNNLMYNMDTRALNRATNRVMNFSTNGLNDHDVQSFNDARGLMESQYYWNARDIVDNMHDDKARNYLLNQIDKATSITQNRMIGESKLAKGERPDIGSVQKAAPDKKSDPNNPQSGLYKLIKGGFNLTGKILKGIYKLAASGASDVLFGMKSIGWGMFGGKNEDGSRHHGLIENLTFDFARGARNLGVGSLKKLAGKARDKWNAGDSGHYKNQRTNDDGSIDFINYTRGEWRDKQKAEGQDLKSRLKGREFGTNMSAWDALTHPIKAVATAFKDVTEPLRKFTKTVVDGAKSIAGSIAGWIKETKVGQFAGKWGGKLFGGLKNSGFGQGFTKAWREKSEAKAAAANAKERASSFINRATGSIMDMFKGSEQSMLTSIADILEHIRINTLPEDEKKEELRKKKEAEEKAKAEEEKNKEKEGEGETQGSTGLGGKIKGFFKRKKKKKGGDNGSDDNGDGDNGEGGEEGSTDGGVAGAIGAASTVGAAVVKNGIGGNIGAILGGLVKTVGGIFKLATSAVLALEGLQAIKQLGEEIFKKGIKPLNQIFQKLYHMLKPLAVQVTNIVKDIAKALTQMLDGVLKTLSPLLKMISDAISTIFDTILKPVMEILDATLSACMVPITLVLDAMKPVLDIMCADLKVVSGVVQMGLGGVMGLLGFIGKGIGGLISLGGKILKVIPGGLGRSAGKKAVKLGNQISEAADDMLGNSKALMVNGAKQFKEGFEEAIAVTKKIVTLEYLDNPEEEKKETVINEERAQKMETSNLANNFAAGDVNTYNTWNYTYGSGNTMNQHTYGSTMNMSERGCGPVALADAYMRRTGSGMSPLTLAGAMMGNGSYEPNRGTSVASMVNTGNALGMNMQVGGVTQRSLNSASPNNPITVMGSGSGFGTKRGNDHYLNVVGSDGRGNSYVSNPLTGRVSKTPTSQLALNSRLGLYGSGDKLPDEFGIDLDSMTALERLQSLSDRFTKIFTGDSTVDKVNKTLDEGKAENRNSLLDSQLSGLTDEEIKTIEDNAMTYAKAKNPKRDGESDEDWEARCKKSNAYQMGLADAKQSILAGRKEEDLKASVKASEGLKSGWDSMDTKMKTLNASLGTDDTDEDGASVSSWQGAVMTPFSPIVHTETNIDGNDSIASPVHDFFAATITGIAETRNDGKTISKIYTPAGGWYKLGKNPDSLGEGSTGKKHEGISIYYDGPAKGAVVRAITGGTVTYVTRDGLVGSDDLKKNGGLGNSVKWRDAAGIYHWYTGLGAINGSIEEGSYIDPGTTIGNIGYTGILDEDQYERFRQVYYDKNSPHYGDESYMKKGLHYIVTRHGPKGNTDDGNDALINPLTYWAYDESEASDASGTMSGDSNEEKMMSYLLSKGMTLTGASGIMAWDWGESRHTPNNANNTAQNAAGYGIDTVGDEQLTDDVEKGVKSKDWFVNSTPAGEEWGYGIAQLVGTHKKNLYERTIEASPRIPLDDMQTQLDYLIYALKTPGLHGDEPGYDNLYDAINNAPDPKEATRRFARHFEAGWDVSDEGLLVSGHRDTSYQKADEFYKKYKNYKPSSNPAGIDTDAANAANKAAIETARGRFISSMRGVSGDATDLIQAVASAFKGYITANPNGTYMNSDYGRVTAPDGYVWEHFRPDCSGFMAAGMKKLGYDFKGTVAYSDSTGPTTFDYLYNPARSAGEPKGPAVITGNGGANDWAWMDIDENDLRPGDIIIGNSKYTDGSYGDGHMAMYLRKNYGLDGGSESILKSAAAYDDVMAGNYDSQKLAYTMPFNTWPNYLTIPEKVLRYIGGSKTGASDKAGTLSSASQYSIQTSTGGKKAFSGSDEEWAAVMDAVLNSGGSQDIKKTTKYNASIADVKYAMKNALNGNAISRLYTDEKSKKRDINYDLYIGDPNDDNSIYDPSGATWSYNPDATVGTVSEKYYISKIMEEIRRMHSDDYTDPQEIILETSGESYYDSHKGYGGAKSKSISKSSRAAFERRGENDWAWTTGGSGDVPALDMNQIFDDASQTMQNAAGAFGGNNVTNVIVRDDQATTDMLTKLSEMTFKVRNERVEELLEELVAYVKTKRKSSTSMVRGTNNYTMEDMFDDEIPEAVVRLSKG